MQDAFKIENKELYEKIDAWRSGLEAELSGALSGDAQKLLEELAEIQNDSAALRDRFCSDIDFGTAGMRGIMGVGSATINAFAIRHATKAVAVYLTGSSDSAVAQRRFGGTLTVAIGCDSRNNSRHFAEIAAETLLANGIDVLLFESVSPVPELAFSTALHGCAMGIMITASHNPKEYNGYKLYTGESAQLGAASARAVRDIMRGSEIFDGSYKAAACAYADSGKGSGTLTYIPGSTRDAYADAVCKAVNAIGDGISRNNDSANAQNRVSSLGIVYTPLNGAGAEPAVKILKRLGFDPHVVPEQADPNGDFPTCPYPNPEKAEALQLAIDTAHSSGKAADLVLANDPDADRLGVVEIYPNKTHRQFSGNEAGILLFDYICHMRKAAREEAAHDNGASRGAAITQDSAALQDDAKGKTYKAYKSIVTTGMIDRIAASSGIDIVNTLTGFKYTGEHMIDLYHSDRLDEFVFAMEESCGYLIAPYVFDKDGISAAALMAVAARYWKTRGLSLADRLEKIYEEKGALLTDTLNFMFYGYDGMSRMKNIMDGLRTDPPHEISGRKVTIRTDYKAQKEHIFGGLKSCCMVAGTRPTGLPSTDAVRFALDGDVEITIRPSGTEPKLKIYISVFSPPGQDSESGRQSAKNALDDMVRWAEEMFGEQSLKK